tara:strand:+ start:63 stop:548 length:486 start_codon:yes stop_codon:yes gene_type:complete
MLHGWYSRKQHEWRRNWREIASDENGKYDCNIYLDENYNRVIVTEVTDSLKYNSNYDDIVYMGPLKVWLINSNEPLQNVKIAPDGKYYIPTTEQANDEESLLKRKATEMSFLYKTYRDKGCTEEQARNLTKYRFSGREEADLQKRMNELRQKANSNTASTQ